MTDLDKLLEAVEAGKFDPGETRVVWRFNDFVRHFEAAFGLTPYEHAWDAYKGSLDAAKRLHDALLPGCGWGVGDKRAGVYINGEYQAEETSATMPPARAWLLAILRAVKASSPTP